VPSRPLGNCCHQFVLAGEIPVDIAERHRGAATRSDVEVSGSPPSARNSGGACWASGRISGVEIRRITESEAVQEAGHLFDAFPLPQATARFLADERHHLLIAYVDGVPAGMVTGVEMTHPDKGTEMFLYELAVDEPFRRQGVGQALASELAALAAERGCYGMWVLTDEDNMAAQATYSRAGAALDGAQVMFAWALKDA
jgi:GNAT superfamily N-acetyltransferase